jgi:phospholipase A1
MTLFPHSALTRFALITLLGLSTHARGQTPDADWRACAATADSGQRLACFDRWAQRQSWSASPAGDTSASASNAPIDANLPVTRIVSVTSDEGCHNQQYSTLSRFWELESGTDCGTFGIRGYRPISLSVIGSDGVNRLPTSENPANVATSATDYRSTETRIQLSVRTKIAQSLLTQGHPTLKDSLWFGYTQQSYWQLFSDGLSRPFRSTDHEPEVVYVYPTNAELPGGWRLRYSGLGVVHQSNGQSLPYSRSWNRVYLMAGAERGRNLQLLGRVWQRLPESAATDDNPGISDFIGRAEVSALWSPHRDHALGVTVRHSLRALNRGSIRLEWMKTLGSGGSSGVLSGLRLHTQLFNGYGDSLIDYNRRRTVLSVGLSLVDW